MAKWLKEYFNFGNHKTKNPPQPTKPDYSKKKDSNASAYQESDLMRSYRLQKEKDFEDPYNNGPGSSLRRLRDMCREQAEEDKSAEKRIITHANPLLYRSHSERKAGSSPTARYTSPKHRLVKVDRTPDGDKNITWSPSTNSKKLHTSDEKSLKNDIVAIRDDYSDPFDARNELKNKITRKREVENNGYMEPYEAQKMMAEIHKQDSQKKVIQLYDTPYEHEGNLVASETERNAGYPSESKLPQDDTRPAQEYDQPWEWNKVIVPTLSAQFNGIEKRQSSPLCDRRRQLTTPDLIKNGGLEFYEIIGERVNPNTPLEKQVWYHGAIGRTDAENLLRLCKECSYLIRKSQSNKNDYSLSLNVRMERIARDYIPYTVQKLKHAISPN
ncbi:SH2 domain-containing adapter protein B-like isoform X2 [Scyliorhinus canicula]|uniref:SH2 domain-containing adapter protein B-like isoform X2 n=1 Tax=Scyliorhinus canicula TaxID=7830 RepID=UPI0018F5902F|nr:SH2 domain-containing adapter protein B-like isoform X2 [Scyliorhinus canicula]